jgi:hypothetical protein
VPLGDSETLQQPSRRGAAPSAAPRSSFSTPLFARCSTVALGRLARFGGGAQVPRLRSDIGHAFCQRRRGLMCERRRCMRLGSPLQRLNRVNTSDRTSLSRRRPRFTMATLFSDRSFAPVRLVRPLSRGLGSRRRRVGRLTGPPWDAPHLSFAN